MTEILWNRPLEYSITHLVANVKDREGKDRPKRSSSISVVFVEAAGNREYGPEDNKREIIDFDRFSAGLVEAVRNTEYGPGGEEAVGKNMLRATPKGENHRFRKGWDRFSVGCVRAGGNSEYGPVDAEM